MANKQINTVNLRAKQALATMAENLEPTGVMKLYDGRSFDSDDDNEMVRRRAVVRHCRLLFDDPMGCTFSSEQRARAAQQLDLYKKHIVNKLVLKMRSAFIFKLNKLGVMLDNFGAVAKWLNTSKVRLEFVEKVFEACFTWPEETKATLYEKLANEVITDEGIIFYLKDSPDKKVKSNIDGIIELIETEALHTARKPIMKGANPGKDMVCMSTRKEKGTDWTHKITPRPKRHIFSYEKVNGWKTLASHDPIAKQVFLQHHGHLPGEKPQFGMKMPPTVTAAASVASSASAARSSSEASAALVTNYGSTGDVGLPPMEIVGGMKADSDHFAREFGGNNDSQEQDTPMAEELLASAQQDNSNCNDDDSFGRAIIEAATAASMTKGPPKRSNSEMSAMTEAREIVFIVL